MLSTRVWLVLPDSMILQWGSLIDTSSLLQCVCAPAIDPGWALLPWSTLGCSLSLCEFGRSCHRVWALLPSLSGLRWWWLVFKCILCWAVSIIRHSGFYAQPQTRTHELDLAGMGSGIIESWCCGTSQHCWQSLNEDWMFIVDSWPHAH